MSTKFPAPKRLPDQGFVIHMLRNGMNPIQDEIHHLRGRIHVSMDHIHAIAHGMNAILG